MEKEKISLGEIAKLYYEQGLTQAEISNKLGISRPIISNKLAEAREKGIVKIFVDIDEDYVSELERRIFSSFNLKGVRVVAVPDNDEELAVNITARTGAQYLSRFIEENDRIGISLGWTMNKMADYFPQLECHADIVVQCLGSITNVHSNSTMDGLIKNFSQKVNAREAYILPCPPIVQTPLIANALLYDTQIQKIVKCIKDCNKVFVNITSPDKNNCFYSYEYINDADLEQLKKDGAVGSICGRFYDKNGNICSPETDARTLGISLDDIKKAEYVLGCIVGVHKAYAVYYALKAGLIDVLVIDSLTAAELVRIINEEQND